MSFLIPVKYNPAFLNTEELIRGFVIRRKDLSAVLDFLKNDSNNHQHLLIIAPKGWGKTTLVLRIVAEVNINKAISDNYYPIVFPEDNYGICTPEEFLLVALKKIRDQEGSEYLGKAYKTLCNESNENRLYDEALSFIIKFSQQQKKRLLLVIENVSTLFDQQMFSNAVPKLYHTFLTEPRIRLLATSDSPPHTLTSTENQTLDLFKIHLLEPLNTDQCIDLCSHITSRKLTRNRVRPLQILTDGNPRGLVAMATYFLNFPGHGLKENFICTLDENTAYFKNRLENLPPQERKVLTTVAEKWQPVTAREIAEAARLNVNLVSAHLQRLINKGEVTAVSGQKGRRKWYQLTDRAINAYFLFRQGGECFDRLRSILDFMNLFYGYQHHDKSQDKEVEPQLASDPTALKITPENAAYWADLGNRLSNNGNRLSDAEQAYHRAIEIEPSHSSFWNLLIRFQFERKSDEKKALETAEMYLNYFNRTAQSLNNIAWLFFERDYKEYLNRAESWCLEAIDKDKTKLPYYYHTLTSILGGSDRWDESLNSSHFFLKEEGFVQKEIKEISDYFIQVAAKGHVEEGLFILAQYKHIAMLEPLTVGLKMYGVQKIMSVHEIRQIGQDIAKRIKEKTTGYQH